MFKLLDESRSILKIDAKNMTKIECKFFILLLLLHNQDYNFINND